MNAPQPPFTDDELGAMMLWFAAFNATVIPVAVDKAKRHPGTVQYVQALVAQVVAAYVIMLDLDEHGRFGRGRRAG